MHLPALHDFHKERPVGLATKVWENSDGSFGFEGVIKATEDCNDVWDKIQKGNYDHVSIFGKREQGNNNCSLPAPLRSGACITTGVRLDSISVCDNNARNDATSLEVRKGIKMVFDADELKKADVEKSAKRENVNPGRDTAKERHSQRKVIQDNKRVDAIPHAPDYKDTAYFNKLQPEEKKADTTDGELQHASTDYAKEKKCGTKCTRKITVKKGEERIPPEDKNKKISGIREPNERDKKAPWAKKPAFDKADTEDVEKGFSHMGDKIGPKTVKRWRNQEDKTLANPGVKHNLKNEVAAGMKQLTGDEEDDTMTEPVKKSKKAKLEPEEPEKFEEPEEEEDEDESLEEEEDESEEKPPKKVEKAEEEEVEKGEFDRQPLEHLDGKSLHQELKEGLKGKGSAKTAKHSQHNAKTAREGRAFKKKPGMSNNEIYADDAAAGLKHMTKAGETMEEEYEEQEFITKAMVPIEEIDTIVKARTEEISKAYIAQFDEIKKAYDAKFLELTSKVEKMENETIRKGGQIVVIPQLMGSDGTGSMSNADALARMQAGR